MAKCVFYVGWFRNFFKVIKSKLLTTDTIWFATVKQTPYLKFSGTNGKIIFMLVL